MLQGKKGLIVGVANDASIAWGCARAFHAAGASLALTYQNDKAKPHVEPLAQAVGAPIFMPLDVTNVAQQDAVFAVIKATWGTLDFVLHAVAFAPKADLQGRVVDSSRDGFLQAMDISCHSFMRLAHAVEPLMPQGGALLTLSYYGAQRVVGHYNLMGPVKAALESSVKYMAHELGPQKIRVNALSTGPVQTRAASGLANFDTMMADAYARAPLHQHITLHDIGAYATFLVSGLAPTITGQTLYIDAGFNTQA